MTAIISERPVTVDRFRRDGLIFEADGDMSLRLKAFTVENGAVLVMLNVDGESRDDVIVEQHHDSISQLTEAIEAMTKAREILRAMGGAGERNAFELGKDYERLHPSSNA